MEVKWTKNLPLMIMGYGIIIIGIGGRINYHFSVKNSMILLIMCSILTIGLVNTYRVSPSLLIRYRSTPDTPVAGMCGKLNAPVV